MAQKSGFFNAMLNAGVYDRKYSADDYCDNLAVIISNGVLRGDNNLKVTASNLNLSVNSGRAWIGGHYFNNDSVYQLPAISAPTGGARIDRVVLRLDKSIPVRSISIQYLTGTAATTPVAPALTRNDTVYELCLAEITIQANATVASVKDTRADADLCGWVYSVSGDNSFFIEMDESFNSWFENAKNTLASVTLFKRYKWETTLESAASTVTFVIPQYDPETCFVEVFVNGMLCDSYMVDDDNLIRFGSTLIAGTEITVFAYKSIDGTGIMTVADEITELQNQYATLSGVSDFVYKATGSNDNISLSDIAQAIYAKEYDASDVTEAADAFLTALGGNTWLANLPEDAHITIKVVGKLHVSSPAYGSGTSASRYRYFNLGQIPTGKMRIAFDFSCAEKIEVNCDANTSNIIFYGTDLEIRHCKINAFDDGASCDIQMVATSNVGRVLLSDCQLWIKTSGDAKIAEQGTFMNCDTLCQSEAGHALSFCPKSNYLIRVIGGTHRAYAILSGKTAAVFYTYGTETNAVIMATNINCPTVTISGYWQQYLSVGYAGKTIIDQVISTMNSTGNYNVINNQVWLSKQY